MAQQLGDTVWLTMEIKLVWGSVSFSLIALELNFQISVKTDRQICGITELIVKVR